MALGRLSHLHSPSAQEDLLYVSLNVVASGARIQETISRFASVLNIQIIGLVRELTLLTLWHHTTPANLFSSVLGLCSDIGPS